MVFMCFSGFLRIVLEFYMLISRILRVRLDFYRLVAIFTVWSWFLWFGLDFWPLVSISTVWPWFLELSFVLYVLVLILRTVLDFYILIYLFCEFILIFVSWLWFLWACLRFLHIDHLISSDSSWFLDLGLAFSELVLICINWSRFLWPGHDLRALTLIFRGFPWFLWIDLDF